MRSHGMSRPLVLATNMTMKQWLHLPNLRDLLAASIWRFNGIDIMGLGLRCFRIMWFKRLRAYKCPGAMAWQGLSWSRGHSKF